MRRGPQIVLISSTLLGSWLAMQAIHECGHVLGAWLTGGQVAQMVLNPLTISRTDLAENPRPLFVTWSGPLFGVLSPMVLWAVTARASWSFVPRFFAGFCLLANGLYIGIGSFDGIGDCGDMLRHGSLPWQLWVFGAITAPGGLWLWHNQGQHFGLGQSNGQVDARVAYGTLAVSLILLCGAFMVGGK